MHDETDVGLVDPHAECVGCDHDARRSSDPLVLTHGAHQVVHAAVIESGRYAVLVQKSRDRFGLFPRADIDDARAGHASDDAQQLTVLVLGTPYDIAQVRPLETHAADVRLAELQAAHDVLGDLGRRRSGQREDRHVGLQLPQPRDTQIGGPEVVAPLGDAVRLVDGQQRHAHFPETGPEQLAVDSLGSYVEKLDAAVHAVVQNAVDVARRHARVDRLGQNPARAQAVDLVLHQRDKRRHNDAYALRSQGGYLIDDRLAASGGHQHERVPSGAHVLDRLELQRAETFVAPVALESLEQFFARDHRLAGRPTL